MELLNTEKKEKLQKVLLSLSEQIDEINMIDQRTYKYVGEMEKNIMMALQANINKEH